MSFLCHFLCERRPVQKRHVFHGTCALVNLNRAIAPQLITIDLHRGTSPVFRNEKRIRAKCCQFPAVDKDRAIVRFKTEQQHNAMQEENDRMQPINKDIMSNSNSTSVGICCEFN